MEKLNHPDLKFNILDIKDIPLYNQDDEANLPAAVVKFKKELAQADGILFATPEYNRSMPGVLKNIIDWGTRPYGQNSWAQKPAAVIGTSPGVIGTAAAQSQLRTILVTVNTILLGQPEVYFVFKQGLIDEDNNITNEDTKKFLMGFLDAFSDWVKCHVSKS